MFSVRKFIPSDNIVIPSAKRFAASSASEKSSPSPRLFPTYSLIAANRFPNEVPRVSIEGFTISKPFDIPSKAPIMKSAEAEKASMPMFVRDVFI